MTGKMSLTATTSNAARHMASLGSVQAWGETALTKLAGRCPTVAGSVRRVLIDARAVASLEGQKRACEYLLLLERGEVHAEVVARLPALEVKPGTRPGVRAALETAAVLKGEKGMTGGGAGGRDGRTGAGVGDGAMDDLAALLAEPMPGDAGTGMTGGDDLLAVLGGGGQTGTGTGRTGGGGRGGDDFGLGGLGLGTDDRPTSTSKNHHHHVMDLLSDNPSNTGNENGVALVSGGLDTSIPGGWGGTTSLAGASDNTTSSSGSKTTTSSATFTAYEGHGVTLTFATTTTTTVAGGPPRTNIMATVAAPGGVRAWSMQAAVPRTMECQLEAPSATEIVAGGGKEGEITQRIRVRGVAGKPIAMRLKLTFESEGLFGGTEAHAETVEVPFPAA